MRTFTLKSIPDDLYERIQQTAAKNRRSMNGEMLMRLERDFPDRERNVKKIIEEARKLRDRNKTITTHEEINEGKRWGRT